MFEDLIDIERVSTRLDELWDIGKTSRGGVTRLAYSEEEDEAIEYILSELSNEYHTQTDSIGNVFASRQKDADKSIFLGSHLDTVFNGGRLDGTLGVVAALEAIEAVHASDVSPAYPPTLTIFRGEESARFGQATIGSRGALGLLTVEDFAAVDDSNIPLWQAMQQAGYHPDNLSEPTIDIDTIAGFLELHIEQGKVLDESECNIGIVTSIRAPVRYRIQIQGDYDHSGATPMELRHDALASAAEMVTTIEEISNEAAKNGDIVATVGDINPIDGAINKVCGEVNFLLDIRSNSTSYRDDVESEILSEVKTIATRRNVSFDIEQIDRSNPVDLDENINRLIESSASSENISHQRLPSGGGHDAMNFQKVDIPTGMLFAPSVDGVSHNPKEETPQAAIHDAIQVLARSIVEF